MLSIDRLRGALTAALDLMASGRADVEYRLVGTGAALLHGVSLPAADIDLLVRERWQVDAIAAALGRDRCLSAPAWLAESRQYYANYEVRGVEVGISTVEVESEKDTIETFGPGPWVHYVLLPCGPYRVPTVVLELRLITELWRGRADRVQPIVRHLRANGCDMALLRRGMAARLPPRVQRDVLGQLGAIDDQSPRPGMARDDA
jgi:hypothetical protein